MQNPSKEITFADYVIRISIEKKDRWEYGTASFITIGQVKDEKNDFSNVYIFTSKKLLLDAINIILDFPVVNPFPTIPDFISVKFCIGNNNPMFLKWKCSQSIANDLAFIDLNSIRPFLPDNLNIVSFDKSNFWDIEDYPKKWIEFYLIGFENAADSELNYPVILEKKSKYPIFDYHVFIESLINTSYYGAIAIFRQNEKEFFMGILSSPNCIITIQEILHSIKQSKRLFLKRNDVDYLNYLFHENDDYTEIYSILISYFDEKWHDYLNSNFERDLEEFVKTENYPENKLLDPYQKNDFIVAFYLLAKKHGINITFPELPFYQNQGTISKCAAQPKFEIELFKRNKDSYSLWVKNKLINAQNSLNFSKKIFNLTEKYALNFTIQSESLLALTLRYTAEILENRIFQISELLQAFDISSPATLYKRLHSNQSTYIEILIEYYCEKFNLGESVISNAINILPILEQNKDFEKQKLPTKAAVSIAVSIQLIGDNTAKYTGNLAHLAGISEAQLERLCRFR